VLNLSDGEHSLLDIATRSELPFPAISDAAEVLRDGGLLSVVPEGVIAGMQNRKVAGVT
jgi:aminopeptidase-like protein